MERRGGCSRLGEFAKSKRISGCQRSSWEKAGFLYVPPPSNQQTSWRYNHLILHHYGLSNCIKPHTWFWLCCSRTTFPPYYYSLFYHACIELPLLMFSSRKRVCAQPEVSPDTVSEQSNEDVDLIFPRRCYELALTQTTSCTWLAVAWSWHWL